MATKTGIIWKSPDMFARFSRDLRLKTDGLADAAALVFEEEAEEGAKIMQKLIMNRGTGYVGRGARAIPEGRIDTGRMHDAVKAHTSRHSTQVTSEFGWRSGSEHYYEKQELGFGSVPPMRSLPDAYLITRERIIERLNALGLKGRRF